MGKIIQIFLFFLIILGTLWSHITREDHFPFSSYPMYSNTLDLKRDIIGIKLTSINRDNSDGDLSIWKYGKPFWTYSLERSVKFSTNNVDRIKKMIAFTKYYNLNVKDSNQLIYGMRYYQGIILWEQAVEHFKKNENFKDYLRKDKLLVVEAVL